VVGGPVVGGPVVGGPGHHLNSRRALSGGVLDLIRSHRDRLDKGRVDVSGDDG
jgi:hypothetical protein